MSDPRQGASLQSLVADAIRDGADLLRQELGLFRAEMADNLGAIGTAVAMFAVAAIFAIASLIWVTQALVYGLAIFVAQWIAALIVGVLLLVVAGIMVMLGKSRLSAASLVPSRTINTLKQDGDVLTERVSG
jgi:low temperature requirement protein LtrA